MPKRKSTFNSKLNKEFPFLKKCENDVDNSTVFCIHCNSSFSIAHGGRSDVCDHIKSKKHKNSVSAKASSKVVSIFFSKTLMGTAEQQLAASEGTFAYHTVMHNHSFRSMDCTSKLIRNLYDQKFTCSKTKCEAIITNVLAPYSENLLKEDLSKISFLSLSTDASNHNDVKFFPLLIRYFIPTQGIKNKLLEFTSLPGETSELISNYIYESILNYNISKKVIALGADNANTNFGGVARRSINNVFSKLSAKLSQKLIGIGCAAHITHNCIQSGADSLPVDAGLVVGKIYQYFRIYTVRVERLKTFCDFVDYNYKKILGHSNTRWLSLMPAIERVLQLYEALRSFFLSEPHCPVVLEQFFTKSDSVIWLWFLHGQLSTFQLAILQMEKEQSSASEIFNCLLSLKKNLESKKKDRFVGLAVKNEIKKLEENIEFNHNVCFFWENVDKFYGTCIDYLSLWLDNFNVVSAFNWVLLKEMPQWNDIEAAFTHINNSFDQWKIDEITLYDEYVLLKKFITDEKITHWNQVNAASSDRWVEVFVHFEKQLLPFNQLSLIVQFTLALPATNAPVERIFSLMNDYWSSDKSQLSEKLLKAVLMMKTNFSHTCLDFHKILISQKVLLSQIHSSEKYNS